jgi:hypothetical protein
MNIYVRLTEQFNEGKLRAVICSGQAVVLHHLAIMSKDGDWIVREDEESMHYLLGILSGHGAHYRFGAPLDIRWMKGGWSSHFEFQFKGLRIRTDFFTRPPRISLADLERMWNEHQSSQLPFVNVKDLAELKKTNREKDYVIIGELARQMKDPRDQLLYSRSARDIIDLAEKYPDILREVSAKRPLLLKYNEGKEKLEELLDAEKRTLIHENEKRLAAYLKAAEKWSAIWPDVEKELPKDSLHKAHQMITRRAENILPFDIMQWS